MDETPKKPKKKYVPATEADFEGERAKFLKAFQAKAQKKALKSLEVLDKIQLHGRAEMARVAAARALMDKVVPNESNVNVQGEVSHVSYADTLRQLAARMRAPGPLVIEAEITPVPRLDALSDEKSGAQRACDGSALLPVTRRPSDQE